MEIVSILCLISFILLMVAYIVWRMYKDGLRQVAIDLIVEAEKHFRDNDIKFHTVVQGIINKLPFPLNLIPIEFIENFVQNVFDEIKIALDCGRSDKT